MRTLCAFSILVWLSKDPILQTRVCTSQSQSHTFYARLLVFDKSAASFCRCKLLWRSGECVLLPCFNTQPDIFAVMYCCVVALSLFSSDILTWSADGLCSVQWHITNFAKTLVWKQEYDVQLWRHKERTPNANDQHMPLNEPPHETIFCVRQWTETDGPPLCHIRECVKCDVIFEGNAYFWGEGFHLWTVPLDDFFEN